MKDLNETTLYATLRHLTLHTLQTNESIAAVFRMRTIGVETHDNGILGFTVELSAPNITAWMHMPNINKQEMSMICDDLRDMSADRVPPIVTRRYTPSRRTHGTRRHFPDVRAGESGVDVAWRLFTAELDRLLADHARRFHTATGAAA